MIKAILFDFDGVLTLDATGTTSICNYIAKVTGIDKDLFNKEYRKYNNDLLYGKSTHEEVWEQICLGLNEKIGIDILYDSFTNTPLDLEMVALVKKLKSSGYVTGLITDNKKDRIDDIVEHCKFKDIFDYIVVSAEIGSGKNHEEIFQKTIEELSLSPNECIFIDNNEKNLVVPKRMGMEVEFFNHENRDINKLKLKLESIGIKL